MEARREEMKFNLASLVKRPTKRPIDIAPIRTTTAQRDDLLRIYLGILKPWNDAAATVMARYERALEQALRTDSAESASSAVDALAAAVNRLTLELTPALRAWAFRIESFHRGKWVRSVLSAASVDLATILTVRQVEETVSSFLARNVSLVRDVNEQARGRIADAVLRGFQRRSPAREVAKEIAEATGMARARALRIASHQTINLAASLDAERHREAGIDHWKWRHSGKVNGRQEHIDRDGEVYTDADAPDDLPGELPGCGCLRQAVIFFGD